MVIDVYECARCGENHRLMAFHKLTRPAEDWTHWGMCTTLNEPVLLRVESPSVNSLLSQINYAIGSIAAKPEDDD